MQRNPFTLGSPGCRMRMARVFVSVLAASVVVIGVVACGSGNGASGADGPARYRTQPVEQGRFQVAVEATGTLQPATQVELGSRVSGQLSRVLVDFNDTVKAGQLLAEIDPTPFRARQNEARAAVASAKAELLRAEADVALKTQTAARAKDLHERQLNSTAELQAAEGALAVAKAQIAVAQAGIERAQASLASASADVEATRITSPIDGIVLARAVEAGQTVAASLQAPRLFVIAEALDALEVVAKVDESDLAIVKAGASASVSVDAFPGQTFEASVRQIRIDPTTESGVVTFPVVLSVHNNDGLLLPGMTATVRIDGPPVENALIIPSAALRFAPATDGKKTATGGQIWVLDGASAAPAAAADDGAAKDGAPKDDAGRGRRDVGVGGAKGGSTGTLRAVPVRVVQKSGMRVQVEAEGLSPGTPVVVEEIGAKSGGRRPPRIF